jgi:hypothetical protein
MILHSGIMLKCFPFDNGRQYLLDTTMDWIGAAHTRNYGYAMLDTLAMVAMVIGLEELEF